MGYYTRYSMRALDPTTHEVVDPRNWSTSYLSSVLGNVTGDYMPSGVSWNPTSGDLFGSESVKWYNYKTDFQNFSRTHPQFIWVLRGDGEDSEDKWVLYAYRGSSYKVKQEPWVPPPPDMSKLPEVIRVAVPEDPPRPEDVLRRIVERGVHAEGCAAYNHPTGFDDGQCNCPFRDAKEALAALK